MTILLDWDNSHLGEKRGLCHRGGVNRLAIIEIWRGVTEWFPGEIYGSGHFRSRGIRRLSQKATGCFTWRATRKRYYWISIHNAICRLLSTMLTFTSALPAHSTARSQHRPPAFPRTHHAWSVLSGKAALIVNDGPDLFVCELTAESNHRRAG